MPQLTLFSTPLAEGQLRTKRIGRPAKYLTEPELNEILQGIISDAAVRKRVIQKYGKQKIMAAVNIFKTDYGKRGAVSRACCPIHKRHMLVFNWHGYGEGTRIKCLAPDCGWTTHFQPMLFHSDAMMGESSFGFE
jgi:hypothetical protein